VTAAITGQGAGQARGARLRGRPKVLAALGLALGVLLLGEIGLQVRGLLKTGRNALTEWAGQSSIVIDPATGLRILRPNSVVGRNSDVVRANSLGLRSPEVTPARAPGSLRILFIGASNVMGLFAPTNEDTVPAQLQARLQRALPGRKVEVINAGILGYILDHEDRMLERLADLLQPDLVLVYPGVNDFQIYCQSAPPTRARREPLVPGFDLPGWLLSPDVLRKNTAFLRPDRATGLALLDAQQIDIGRYRRGLEAILASARRRGIPIVLSTNTRSYRPGQSPELQAELSANARYYYTCIDVPGLHTLYKRHNDLIFEVARAGDTPVLDLDTEIPGGADHFADSTHFNAAGRALAADRWAAIVLEHLPPTPEGRP
jgi:lysophospholipase L1-like esterase